MAICFRAVSVDTVTPYCGTMAKRGLWRYSYFL
jgi:hypothetical protein